MSAPRPAPARIVTVTLNPAIDETIILDDLVPGAVNRAGALHRQAGGKGVNVSHRLSQLGIRSTATGFLGDRNPGWFEELFRAHGIDDHFIRIPGETRTGIKLLATRSNTTTDINFPGLTVSPGALGSLAGCLRGLLTPGSWCVISGSLPPGVTTADFTHLLETARSCGAAIGVDTSGPALKAAIGFGVDLVKPNRHELAEATGIEEHRTTALIDAAGALHAGGISHVILSLGEDGACAIAADGQCHAPPPPAKVASTVGAGDALLAGYLAGLVRGHPLRERLALASTLAWCALEDLGRNLPDPGEVARRVEYLAGTVNLKKEND